MLRVIFTFSLFFLLFSSSLTAQFVYFDSDPIDVTQSNVRVYIDVSAPACNCEAVADADQNDPLYFWSWGPSEIRPPLFGMDINNGDWSASNPNMIMTQDPDNPGLWYYDFLGASIVQFYDMGVQTAQALGMSFLVKKFNGGGDPEQKSPDMFLPLLAQQEVYPNIDLELELFASGFSRPCELVNSGIPSDERLFVVEQAGRIRILNPDGSINPTPFLNISGSVLSVNNEQGLLGLAFAPDYETSGHFYVNYTRTQGLQTLTQISRFTVDEPNANQANPDSEDMILDFLQDFPNHNGGQLAFGPDGYLYIASGDGGSGGDPNDRAQNTSSFLGKMLRIDVSSIPYGIPSDNPFVDAPAGLPEIWSYGLRNPWKFAFDELTGDMFIGDVGQNSFEEVNFEPADALGGANYGWRCYEGNAPFALAGCTAPDYVFPILDYAYGIQGNGFRCSITGGRVYRGNNYPNLYGKYIATDYCNGEYWALWQQNGVWQSFLSPNTIVGNIVAFGTDKDLELYAVKGGSNGQVYRVKENCSALEATLSDEENGVLAVDLVGDSFIWFLDGEELTTSVDPQIEINANGSYNVQVFTSNGCVITSNTLEINSLDLDYSAEQKMMIYPNPAKSEMRLVLGNSLMSSGDLRIDIFSVDGRLVQSNRQKIGNENGIVLNISDLNRGLYLLKINAEGFSSTATFMKQ
jgi:glucose/arabinose dehydrogenase